MSWLTLTLLCVLLVSGTPLLQRVLLRDPHSDSRAFAILFQIANGVIIGLFGLFFSNMSLPNLLPYLPNLVIMVFLYGIGNLFMFAAFKRIEASIFMIIFASKPIFTLLSSTVILRGGLSPLQLAGLALIIVAVILTSLRKGLRLKFGRGEFYALLVAALFGFETTNDRIVLGTLNVYPYVTLTYLLPAFLLWLSYPRWYQKAGVYFSPKNILKFSVLCLLYAGASIAFSLALQIGQNSSQVTAINQISTVVTVLLAIILLKERDNLPQKLVAAILSVVGVILVK